MFSYILEITTALIIFLSFFAFVIEGDLCAWTLNIRSYEFVERLTVLFVFYQVIVFITLSLYDSIRKDAILSLINIYNLALINLEYGIPFEQIQKIKEELLENKSIDYKANERNKISNLIEYYEAYSNDLINKNEYEYFIKNRLIFLQHDYEYYDLGWRISFVLRYRKNK